MRRLLVLLLTLLPASLLAQTTVNLTVQDTPDNQLWFGGSWSVVLKVAPGQPPPAGGFVVVSGGGSTASQSGSLSSTATASISLPANANITPVNSVWLFNVCPQAQGNGSQCYQQSVTVTVSSPQTLSITPPSIRINLLASQPPVSGYADGEFVGVAIGSTYYQLNTTSSSAVNRVCQVVSGNTCTTWANSGGSSSPVPGVFNSNFDPPLFQNYTLSTTGAQTAINLTATPIDTHTISWRPANWTASITDTFSYSNGDLHGSNANWVYQTGSFSVTSNVAYPSAALALAYRSDGPNTGAEWAQATEVLTVATSDVLGPCVRIQTGSTSGYCVHNATNYMDLYVINSGTPTTLLNYSNSASIPANGNTVKISASGTTICIYLNNAQVGCVTDSTYSTGYTGIYGGPSNTANGFSNFQSGTMPSCQIELDSSPDGTHWNNSPGSPIPTQSCLTAGSFQATNQMFNYGQVNLTALSGISSVAVVYSGRLAPAVPANGTSMVANGQKVYQGQVLWTQYTSQGVGSVSVVAAVSYMQAGGTQITVPISIGTCSLSANGGYGFAYQFPTDGVLQSAMTFITTNGVPQGAVSVQEYILSGMPPGGTTTSCTNNLTQTQFVAILGSWPTGSEYPVGFTGTSAFINSPWSIPGYTTTLVPTTPGAGADISYTFTAQARTCIQSISAQLVTSASAGNRLPAFIITINNVPVVYSAATAQTAGTTHIYSLSPGASGEQVTTGSTVYHIIPFNNGQMVCTNAGLTTLTFTTLTAGILSGDQWTPKGILVQVQQDNN